MPIHLVITFLNPGIVTPNMKDIHGGIEKDFEIALAMLHDMEQKGELKLRTFPQPFYKAKKGDPATLCGFRRQDAREVQ
jgi:hypothetical protein